MPRSRWLVVPVLAGLGTALVLRRRSAAGRVEGDRWYGLVYRAAYRLGFTPWDRGAAVPSLVDIVDGASALPPGRALDIGCGTGTNAIYLAERGWDAVGVDMVPGALAIARRRAEEVGVSPCFVEGDVTRLRDFGVGGGYDLLTDIGCFHTIPADRRQPYVESVTEAAAPGATFLLVGCAPSPRISPVRTGITPEEVERRFSGWEILSADRLGGERRSTVSRWFEGWIYRLRRQAEATDVRTAAGG
jgi:SAM-dependent methyltransferase